MRQLIKPAGTLAFLGTGWQDMSLCDVMLSSGARERAGLLPEATVRGGLSPQHPQVPSRKALGSQARAPHVGLGLF